MLRELFVLAFLATLSFTVYAHIKPDGTDLFWLYVTYVILISAAWLIWYVGYRRRFQSKHQDYRGLAEGLRVQFFWRIAGLPDLVEATYLGMQRGELEWIRKAIRVWSLPREGPARLAPADAIGLPQSHWVKDQLGFYSRAAAREHRHAERYRRASRVLFGVFLLQAVFVGALKLGPWHLDHMTREWLLVSMSVFVVASALVHNYAEKRAFSEHSKHYQRMALIFDRAREVLGGSGEADVDSQRAVLRELGREALTENGDWVLLHRQRPIEVPEGEGLRGALPEALR